MDRLRVLVSDSNKDLGDQICKILDCDPIVNKMVTFPNNEVSCEIKESVRGEHVFLIQSICNSDNESPNDNLMKLLVMIDALRRSSVKSISAVIPHLGYARQDRQASPRTPVTSRLVADMIQMAGANQVITVDIHSTQSCGFFTTPIANLYAAKVLGKHIKKEKFDDLVIISPDAGGATRARYFAKRFGTDIALIDKRRSKKDNTAQALHVVGDVEGRDCVIFDDMIDTAGTLIEGVMALKANGANSIMAAATHGVFSGPAFERISNCKELKKVIVTDTIKYQNYPDKIEVVSIADTIAKAIKRSHEGGSVSSMF